MKRHASTHGIALHAVRVDAIFSAVTMVFTSRKGKSFFGRHIGKCPHDNSRERRRSGGSTTYKVQPRRHEGVRQTWRALQLIARLCETCMHRTSTLVLGIGVAFARSNS